MTHLRIEQNNGLVEEVGSSIIKKLYELAIGGLDNTSNLQGRLHASKAYGSHIQYLTQTYPELHISVDDRYINFADSEVLRILSSNFGDGVGITEREGASITNISTIFKDTTIQTFNELPQLGVTTLNSSAFYGCTELSSVDTTNITSLNGGQQFEDCSSLQIIDLHNCDGFSGPTSNRTSIFKNCTSVKKIILGNCISLGNKWATYSSAARVHFYNCQSLETVDVKSLQQISTNGGIFNSCPNMRNFIIRSATVPVKHEGTNNMQINAFGGQNVKIYVPDEAVQDYKTADAWVDVAQYIYPLSEYTES